MLWSPNLQLYYPFENTALDYSGNARHGTVFGTGAYATRPNAGRCLYFDGVGDRVKTPFFGLSGTVVVSAAWVRCKFHAVATQTFLGDHAQSATVGFFWCYRPAGTNICRWRYASGGISTAEAPNFFAAPFDDVWLHLVAVCDYAGKNVYFYRNRILHSTIGLVGIPVFPSIARPKYLGSYSPTGHFLTDGYMDEFGLWTLPTMPAAAPMLANVNRIMMGMHPIW